MGRLILSFLFMPAVIISRAFFIRSSSLACFMHPGFRDGVERPNAKSSFSKSDMFSVTGFVVKLAHSETKSFQGLSSKLTVVEDNSSDTIDNDDAGIDVLRRWARPSSDSSSLNISSHVSRVMVLKQDTVL